MTLSSFAFGAAGTTAGNFLKIAVGARPASMGEAYLALADDSSSFLWNPAGTGQLTLPEVSIMHLSYFADINYEYVGFAMPWQGQGIGLGVTWLNVPSFNSTLDENAQKGSAADYAITGAYALSLSKQLLLGGSAKGYISNLASTSAMGFTFDVGAIFKPFGKGLALAVVAQNIGAQTSYENASDPLPVSLRLGAAWRLYDNFNRNYVNAVVDMNKSLENRFKYNVGLEGWLFDLLALRAGYKLAEGGQDFANVDPSDQSLYANFTAGAGFRYEAATLDYAFVPLGELGYTHRVSLAWKFGFNPTKIDKEKVLQGIPKFGKLQGTDESGVAFNLDSKRALGGAPVREWWVDIRDEKGNLVRSLTGEGSVPRNLAWDMRQANGEMAPRDQSYRYAVTLRDVNGKTVLAEGFIAKEVKPKDLMSSAPSFDAAKGGLVFKPQSAMTVGVKEWKLNIRDQEGNVLKTISGFGTIPKNLVWKPEEKAGAAAEEDLLAGRKIQQVKYDIEFKDAKGESRVVSDVVRFATGKAEEKSYKLPLPLKEFKVNSGKEVLVASLPNLTSTESGAAKSAPFVMPVPQAGSVRSWKFEIISEDGRTVRSFQGKSELPDNIYWDGLDETGVPVSKPDRATFNFQVTSEDGKELSTKDRKTVRNPFTVATAQGQIKKITGIWFRFLDIDIQDAVMGKLKEIAATLRRNPNVQVTIQGHGWDEGSGEEILRLSQERADSVLRFLIENEGISPRNVSAIGYGDTMPITTAKTTEAADRNRRVEVIIVSKNK